MIKVMIYTMEFEKWIEKISKSVKLNTNRGGCRITRNEVFLVDEGNLISFEIHRRWNESQRGKVADVIILDRDVDWDYELMRVSLLGHRGSIINV